MLYFWFAADFAEPMREQAVSLTLIIGFLKIRHRAIIKSIVCLICLKEAAGAQSLLVSVIIQQARFTDSQFSGRRWEICK